MQSGKKAGCLPRGYMSRTEFHRQRFTQVSSTVYYRKQVGKDDAYVHQKSHKSVRQNKKSRKSVTIIRRSVENITRRDKTCPHYQPERKLSRIRSSVG